MSKYPIFIIFFSLVVGGIGWALIRESIVSTLPDRVLEETFNEPVEDFSTFRMSEPHWRGKQSNIYIFDGSDTLNYDTMELVEGTYDTFSEDVYQAFGAPARFVGDTFEREAEPFENDSEFTPFKALLVRVLDAADTYMEWVPINDNSHYLVIYSPTLKQGVMIQQFS